MLLDQHDIRTDREAWVTVAAFYDAVRGVYRFGTFIQFPDRDGYGLTKDVFAVDFHGARSV